jgi:hypothetical protein
MENGNISLIPTKLVSTIIAGWKNEKKKERHTGIVMYPIIRRTGKSMAIAINTC